MNLQRAVSIAIDAHKDQFDKVGKPYITHVFRVMEKGRNDTEKICGVLHDVVEDTPWTLEELEAEGFAPEIIETLALLTHDEQDSYESYIQQIHAHPIACRIKIHDLEDNMDIRRLPGIVEKDVKRLNQYIKAYHLLTGKGEEND